MDAPQVLGWREQVAFPDLNIEAVEAKLDTGAKTSSMHASDIEGFERDGEEWLRFTAILQDGLTQRCEAPLVGTRWVRSSNGEGSLRPVIRTSLELGGSPQEIHVTLARRDSMEFRIILGRHALRGKCIVDPDKVHVLRTMTTTAPLATAWI